MKTKKKGASEPQFLGLEGIQVNLILDSVNTRGQRLTTLHLRYPRMVHSELMTHRVFSRNARSSRAVPVTTLEKEPFYLPFMQYNQSGMQPAENLTKEDQAKAQAIWLEMCEFIREKTQELNSIGAGVHKQWANRPSEPFGWIDVLVTSSEWNNFILLRTDSDAQIEIRRLAFLIKETLETSVPQVLKDGEWHVPYITPKDLEDVKQYQKDLSKLEESRYKQTDHYFWTLVCQISAARCARISYKVFSGESSIHAELERYKRLAGSSPVHASPLEHQGLADAVGFSPHHHGNFKGFVQFRKLIPNEYVPG